MAHVRLSLRRIRECSVLRVVRRHRRGGTGHNPDSFRAVRDLHEVFREVHQHGRKAFLAGDYKTFGEAIAIERTLIEEQRTLAKKRLAHQRPINRRRRA